MSLDLTSKNRIKAIFNQYGAYPSKGLGQNFLINKSVLKKIIKSADLTKKEVILEIGPGIGNLTRELAHKAKRIIAVEKDPKLVRILKETLEDFENIEIIQGDILKIQDAKYPKAIPSGCYGAGKIQDTYKIVANLPFYIVAPVIRKFLESEFPPKEMVLVVQKEVGQRICAKPPKMNLLAVSVQFYAEPEIISYVSKKSFWPQPKVDSAILKIIPRKSPTRPGLVNLFFRVVKAGFSQPRQMLINNLAKKLEIEKEKIKEILKENNISPSQRPETLTIKNWRNLARDFSAFLLL